MRPTRISSRPAWGSPASPPPPPLALPLLAAAFLAFFGGGSPASRDAVNSASSQTSTPFFCASAIFFPASAPATSIEHALVRELATFAPAASALDLASAREKLMVPVKHIVLPSMDMLYGFCL